MKIYEEKNNFHPRVPYQLGARLVRSRLGNEQVTTSCWHGAYALKVVSALSPSMYSSATENLTNFFMNIPFLSATPRSGCVITCFALFFAEI